MSPRATSPEPDLDPGSPEAVEAGCTCSALDNHCGVGFKGQPGVFLIQLRCPLHGDTENPGP